MVLDRGFAYQSGGAVYFDVLAVPERSARSATTTRRRCWPTPPSGAATSTTCTSATRWTSCSGSRRRTTSRRGRRCGDRAGPGWHIECSALALRELGSTIDLHGGGTDLIFPHHECERAQSEAATGEPFVRHWMHVGMVRKDGEKMSKSLGNLVFVDQLRETWDPRAIRLAVLEHHYRHSWEWDEAMMPRAAARLDRWLGGAGAPAGPDDDKGLAEVRDALDDDLDTPARAGRGRRRRRAGRGRAARPRALLGVDLAVKRQPSDSKTDSQPVTPNLTRRQRGPRRIGGVTPAARRRASRAPSALQDRWRAVAAPLARRLWRLHLEGYDRIPSEGPAILCPNHISFLDSAFLMLTVPRRISFVGKAEYMDSWKTKHLFPALGMIPIDRSGGDRSQAPSTPPRRCCAAASCSASSPRAPGAVTGRSTAATPARPAWRCKVGCPIFPVGVIGTREIQPPDAKMPKVGMDCTIRVGRPIKVDRYQDRAEDRLVLRQITDELMFEIRELTGQEYRDVYATKKAESSRRDAARVAHVDDRCASREPELVRGPTG